MSRTEQPFLVVDPNARYAGFRTRPIDFGHRNRWIKFSFAAGIVFLVTLGSVLVATLW